MTERIENLQSQEASLQSENERFESEVQKLQQKLKVMTELYQENEMKLHRCWILFLCSVLTEGQDNRGVMLYRLKAEICCGPEIQLIGVGHVITCRNVSVDGAGVSVLGHDGKITV